MSDDWSWKSMFKVTLDMKVKESVFFQVVLAETCFLCRLGFFFFFENNNAC